MINAPTVKATSLGWVGQTADPVTGTGTGSETGDQTQGY